MKACDKHILRVAPPNPLHDHFMNDWRVPLWNSGSIFGISTHEQNCFFSVPLCINRLTNHENPICVDACSMRVLGAGLLKELETKYGRIREAEGFVYSNRVNPSVVFKPKMK